MPEAWREKIQATVLIKHLMDHIEARKEMNKSQVTAAIALLKKVAPDLQSVAHGQDPELGPVQLDTITRPPLTREAWLKAHGG